MGTEAHVYINGLGLIACTKMPPCPYVVKNLLKNLFLQNQITMTLKELAFSIDDLSSTK